MKECQGQQSMFCPEASPYEGPVSLSVWPVNKEGKRTTGFYGPRCFESSKTLRQLSLSVRTYLESSTSRLTMFAPTWSVLATKSGYLILKLRLSERRTGENESRLWPTPKANKVGSDGNVEIIDGRRVDKNGNKWSMCLTDAVKLWPTPRAKESGDYQYSQGDHDKPVLTLTGAVKMWPTPTRREYKGARSPEALLAAGRTTDNSLGDAVMATDGGQLNPKWVELLMGFPAGWTETKD